MRPTKRNLTGVESYDHGPIARLIEYHEARKALDDLVHRINADDEIELGQAGFLSLVEEMAASLSYADSSGHPFNDCPGSLEGAWPYRTEVKGEWVAGYYRCAYCGREWTCGYDVNVAAVLAEVGL